MMSESATVAQPTKRACRLRDRLYKYYKQDSTSFVLAPPTQKDNAVANKMRLEGHSHFLASHFVNAIYSYNKSLCHSEITGDRFNLSMAYGHRAEAYFKMGLYPESLASIELALASNYPTKFINRMTIMQRKCEEQIDLGAIRPPIFTVKLSHPANEKIPSLIEGLRLAENVQFGRHIISEKQLAVGDVIAMEDSYLSGLNHSDLYKRCSHCFSEQRHTLFPCSFCTVAMFCSQRCEKDAWNEYHRYECSILEHLLPLEPAIRLAVRALFVGLNIFKDFATLKKFLTKSKGRKVSVFDLDYRHLDEQERFLSFCQLFRDDHHFGRELNTQNMKRAAEILRLLKHELSEHIDSKEMEVFLLKFLYHAICIHLNNAYEMGTFLPNVEGSCSIGVGLFLSFSMASHSCAPNVMRIQRGRTQYWIVVRPIRAGDQVLDNYGMSFQKETREERQARSFSHYGFKCQCEACEQDYPLKNGLPWVFEIPDRVLSECAIDSEDRPRLVEKLRKVSQFLQQYDKYYPCQQLLEADGIFWNLYRLVLNVVSMEYRFIQFYKAEE